MKKPDRAKSQGRAEIHVSDVCMEGLTRFVILDLKIVYYTIVLPLRGRAAKQSNQWRRDWGRGEGRRHLLCHLTPTCASR